MKRMILLVLFFGWVSLIGQTPELEWAVAQEGGDMADRGYCIVADNWGNVFVTGHEVTSSEDADIFVSKFNSNGQLIWKFLFGEDEDESGYGIATDIIGNVYVTGDFEGTVDFDPGPEIYELTSGNSNNTFILKLDTNGAFVWAKVLYGNGGQTGRAIVLDDSDNLYITGPFYGSVDFDPGSEIYNFPSNIYSGTFILKLNSDGDFVWAKPFGGSGTFVGDYIELDTFSNIYISGRFTGTAIFDSGQNQSSLTAMGIHDLFVLKLTDDGDFIWAKSAGGNLADVNGSGIQVGDDGSCYIVGDFLGTVDFDTGLDSFNLLGTSNIFILKLDINGDYEWVNTIDKAYPTTFIGKPILLSENNDIYITGSFSDTVDFDLGPAIYDLSVVGSFRDVFILKLDENGLFSWVGSLSGTGLKYSASITSDKWGNIYTTGSFSGAVDFDPNSSIYELTANGGSDVFIHKMSQFCTVEDTTSLALSTCDSLAVGITELTYPNQNGCDSIVIQTTTLTALPQIPIAPADLTIQQNAPPFQLTIPEIPNATSYFWQVPPGIQILSGANTNTITINWDDQLGTGTICVSALNECGNSPADCLEVSLDFTDALKNIQNKGYSVFPNPTDAVLNVVFERIGDYEIVLLDVLGRVVIPSANYSGQAKIETSGLLVGTYWMKISRGAELLWERVEIRR